jgi:hypothetical protein
VPFLLAERARSECARSMSAVKDKPGHALCISGNKRQIRRPSHGLVARFGMPVGGRVKMPRPVWGTLSYLL